MATYTYTNSFSIGGTGVNGATVNAYKASQFSSPPALNAAASGSVAATTVTSASAGFSGAFAIALPTNEDYYISVAYSGTTYWLGPVSSPLFADGTAQGGTANAATFDSNYTYNVPNTLNQGAISIQFISGRSSGNTGFAAYDALGAPITTLGNTGGWVVYGDRVQAANGVFGPYVALDGETNPPSILLAGSTYAGSGRIWGYGGTPAAGWSSGTTAVNDLWYDNSNGAWYQCTVSGAGSVAGTWTTAWGVGAQVALSQVTANFTNTTAVGSTFALANHTSGTAASISLPNDGRNYRVEFTAPAWATSTADECFLSIGTSPTARLATIQNAFMGTLSTPLSPLVVPGVTGSGQVLNLYSCSATTGHTVTVVGGAGDSMASLAAYRVG